MVPSNGEINKMLHFKGCSDNSILNFYFKSGTSRVMHCAEELGRSEHPRRALAVPGTAPLLKACPNILLLADKYYLNVLLALYFPGENAHGYSGMNNSL